MTEKLIIENTTNLPMLEVLGYVRSVIAAGKVSNTSKGNQYAFVVRWERDGITVYSKKNKSSDKILITREVK